MEDPGELHDDPIFGKSPEALIHDLTITDGATRLFAHMHWRYGQNKKNFEGQVSMADFFGVSDTTIRNRINELAAKDWVVVIYRGRNKKTGNFTTPYYHVFVDQALCRQWRETYKPKDGETVAPKPEPRERKLRKGKGGNPKNLPRANSGSDGRANSGWDGVSNSSSGGAPNSGWDYLDSVYPDSLDPESEKNIAPSGAPVPGNAPDEPVKEPVEPSEDDWTPPWHYEYPNPETGLYDCTPQNIASLIKACWDWLPVKPKKRGKQLSESAWYPIPANREHAENLWKRGVRPGDFIECLIEMRSDERYKNREMTFAFVAEIVDQWCATHMEDRIYTMECPRHVPRAPGVHIDVGDLTDPRYRFRRLFDNPNLIVDVPPPYISAQEAAEPDDDEMDADFQEYMPTAEDYKMLADEGMPPL